LCIFGAFMRLHASREAANPTEPPVAYPGAPPDSERAQRPPLPETAPEAPYKPYDQKPAQPEIPYQPYTKKPVAPEARYEPYKDI
jgi:hypothetical protein